eukprot:4951915-Pyramimonas_sp.AAC.3
MFTQRSRCNEYLPTFELNRKSDRCRDSGNTLSCGKYLTGGSPVKPDIIMLREMSSQFPTLYT